MDQNLVNRGVIGEDGVANEIARLIQNDQAKLVDLVQMLGEYLTKDEQSQRSSATGLFASVLAHLDAKKLTKQQLNVVVSFLCDRLEDEASVKQVALALQATVQMANFSVASNLDNIVVALRPIHMKRNSQNIRFEVYKLVDLLTTWSDKCNQQEFVKTFVELATGEKDPRNLMICFKISHKILQGFQLNEDEVGEMFDVTFCYFPITFEPPKDDPYGITSQDLKQALRKSISTNGEFAKDAFPGLVEKLNSSVESVKIDTFETLLACIDNYKMEYVSQEWNEIWDGVKYEVLHGSDEETEDSKLALKTLLLLGSKLQGDDRQAYIDSVKKETQEKLDPGSKFVIPATKLITTVAQSSPEAFCQLRDFLLPTMFAKYDDSPTVAAQRSIIQVFILTLAAASQSQAGALEDYKDRLISALASALMGSSKNEVSLRKLAVEGLLLMCQVPDFATPEEVGLVVQYLNDTVLQDDNDELCNTSILSLSKLSDMYPDTIASITIPAFLAQLPDSESPSERSIGEDKKGIDFVLSALASVSANRQLFETLKVRLLAKLEVVCENSTYRYPLAIISTLFAVVQHLEDPLTGFVEKLVVPLYNKVLATPQLHHDTIVDATANIGEYLARCMDDEEAQAVLATKLTDAFVEDNNEGLFTAVNVFQEPTNLAQLLTLTLAPLSAKLPVDGDRLVQKSVAMLSTTSQVFQRGAYLRLIALCSNKWLKQPLPTLAYSTPNELEVAAYYGKGLILRNDDQGYQICDAILDLLASSDELGAQASKVFGVLVCDDPVLSKQNRLTIRLLYKQRFFTHVLPKLVGSSKSVNQENYLTALAALLRYTPNKIIVPELQKILPLLLDSITIDNPRVQEAAIDTIHTTLVESSSLLTQQVDAMVAKLTTAKDSKSAIVRIAALRCLGALPSTLPLTVLQPYRNDIIGKLVTSIGDPKRNVRKEAVHCRQQYYEM